MHKSEVAKELWRAFRRFGIARVEDIEERKEDLKKIFSLLKAKYPPSTGK